VARLVVFCGLTFRLGFLSLSGVTFLLTPQHISQALHLPFASVQPVSVVFLMIAGSYVLAAALRRAPLRVRGWEFYLPSARLSLDQIAIFGSWPQASSTFCCPKGAA
jgi:uncharacterized membrane protein YbhN (UPF0104 family)